MGRGTLIGRGKTAAVYEWGDRQVLKLYEDWFQPDWIRYEAEINRAIVEAGVPAPRVYEMLLEDGRNGLLYERLNGPSLMKRMQASPIHSASHAKGMAQLHLRIHRCTADGLPGQKEKLEEAILYARDLLGERTERILRYLHGLPNGRQVCHGDFHPDNIIVTKESFVAIDWVNAHIGDPAGDVARTSIMFCSPALPPGLSPWQSLLVNTIRRFLHRVYMKEYFRRGLIRPADVQAWMLPVAAARLKDDVPGERDWMLALIDRTLQRMA